MYPTLFTETGNMIDEEKQPEEPISPSPVTLKDLKVFPIVDDDSLMMTTKEKIKIYVYQGNLCYLNVQGIVSSSNEYMNHSSGLLSVIAKEAGEKMLDDCRSYLADKTKLQQGKVCATTAGGHGGPKQICFSSFATAITQYSSKHGKTTSIKEIHFVDQDPEVLTLIQTAFLLALDESCRGKDSKLMKIPLNVRKTFLCYVEVNQDLPNTKILSCGIMLTLFLAMVHYLVYHVITMERKCQLERMILELL
ncbi:unnamed protein product [Mytilus coruscus]|uniref:Macro domain-containing protein n=1 Tax=Mytilus coruscus TaxID=42192 RepID=A0A6J8D7E5_MYTCO|nr:unnamed protein product [Mytilus coruscus]